MKRNSNILDLWSIQHFFSGLFVGLILTVLRYKYPLLANGKIFFSLGIALLIIWEIIEISLRTVRRMNHGFYRFLSKFVPRAYFGSESKKNILSDIVIGAIGIFLIYSIL